MVRQLTAIMFTDMVGFTALMQVDEHRARRSRDRQSRVLDDAVAAHGGRILQFYGDGSLSVFPSAIEAVRCAIEVQEALRADPPVPLRIGVHTGDVVHDEHGVFGDGVNVAARIQTMSVPGGILVSDKVYDELKNQPDIRATGLGDFNLKNVRRNVGVWAISNDGLAIPSDHELGPRRPAASRSVAVLPFVNMSPDPENEYFSDGMTEEIINALTRINGLQVTARTSSFAFKGRNQDVRRIAGELGVTHVLEGSVRRAGRRVRVAAQLICAEDGYHLFSEVYDRDLEDIFGVQDEISRLIVDKLAGHLSLVPTAEDERPMVHHHARNTEAYAEYLRGRFEWARLTPEGARQAIRHFERSARLDPECALPHTGIATAYGFLGAIGHLPAQEAFERAEQAARSALTLEEDAGESHVALASVQLFYHWDWDAAYRSFQKALSLTPGSAEVHHLYSMYLRSIGSHDEAIDEMRIALQLDPLSLPYNHSLGQTLLGAGHLEEAEEQLELTLAMDRMFRPATETLGWVHLARGDLDRALECFEQLPSKAGHKYAAAANRGYAYALLGREDEARDMLALLQERAALQPKVTLAMDFAIIHQGLGDLDRAFEHLERAVDARMGAVVFIATSPLWDERLRADPRFDRLLERIGFPQTVLA